MVLLIFKLYVIQISAFLAIWLATYFSYLSFLLSLLYLFLIVKQSIIIKSKLSHFKIFLAFLVWQLPGLILSFFVIFKDIWEYALFALHFWHMPVIPILSMFTWFTIYDMPLHYYVLFIVSPLLILLSLVTCHSKHKIITR